MITKGIILVCTVIFILIVFNKNVSKQELAIKYGALYYPKIDNDNEYWRFLSANFVHVEFPHFAMNMYAIYYLGDFFERIMGSAPYLYLVLFSCLGSSLLTYYFTKRNLSLRNTITLGASGIFYGFLGAMVMLGILIQGSFLELLQSYYPVIAINVVFTLINPRISKSGHMGGFIGGALACTMLILTGAWRLW